MGNDLLTTLRRARRLMSGGDLAAATGAIREALGQPRPDQHRPSQPRPSKPWPKPQPQPHGRRPGPSPSPPGEAPQTGRFVERVHDDRTAAVGARSRLAYKLYTPANVAPRPLLVVMLHGCTQDPDDFARGTAMNRQADRHGFLVAYPRQEAAANPSRCWNWFEPSHQGRSGEPALIAAMARAVAAEHGCERIVAAGLSAGGAMAAILGAAHHDTFAAVGIHSGLVAGAASDAASAFQAMRAGAAHLRAPGSSARAIVFHGEADRTVAPVNGEQLASAGRRPGVESRIRVQTLTRGGRSCRRMVLPATDGAGADGAGALEYWSVAGLGHAWSGGDPAGSYADPAGPDASAEMARFFLERDGA